MEHYSGHERRVALERMEAEGVDVLIVGGGITGAAVAMDAAARGLRVGVVEKADFASGTSSKSTKLVHGGLRYLPQLDFALVREALQERRLLFQNAPWIVHPIGFILPIYRWNRRPLGLPFALPFGMGAAVRAGLMLYDILAGRGNIHRHQHLPLPEARRRAPALRQEMRHAFAYYDGQTDDSRLTMAVLRTAIAQGALAANYAEVLSFDIASTRVRGAWVRDTLTGREYAIRARHVVNAGGVFAQRIEELTGLPSSLSMEPAKGVHLLFSRDKIPMTDDALILPETDDGRVLFLVPWENHVLVGTTDTDGGDIDRPTTSQDDTAYLLAHCNRYLNVTLTEADILSTYAGFRPLLRSRDSVSTSKLSRTHAVLDGPAGIISIVGGKLTTWRKMAEDTMNVVAGRDGKPPSGITRGMALDGTDGWRETEREMAQASLAMDQDIRTHLLASYGAHARRVLTIADENPLLRERIVPGLPYLKAEIVYACRFEMAAALDDALSRRTRLVLEDRQQGQGVAPEMAALMASELGWDEAEAARQIQAYHAIVQENYRQTPPQEASRSQD